MIQTTEFAYAYTYVQYKICDVREKRIKLINVMFRRRKNNFRLVCSNALQASLNGKYCALVTYINFILIFSIRPIA
jgi:hypothetical protein